MSPGMLFGSWMLWGIEKEPNAFLSWGSCGMWSFPPFLPLTHPPLYFLTQTLPKFRSVQSAKQANQSRAFWLLIETGLPNMHENVTVCLEAVCRACKFEPQRGEQKQTERSQWPESLMAALVPSKPHCRLETLKKQPLGHELSWCELYMVTTFSVKCPHKVWGLCLIAVKHYTSLLSGLFLFAA